ncbi:MAG: leucine-rich repeat domain-containing protein [Candidatus Omnitrophica bacterium]|nr:leucine-rich repeat domain-containing protein [Candidatus Omnitrophota bacterium]
MDIIGFLKKYYINDSPELITELALPSGGIKCMPKYLGMLRKLNYLDLSHNELESLPLEIGAIKNLKNLYLADNNLTSLPKSIKFLSKLTELSLARNKLKTLPESIENLTNLTDLRLEQNQLTTLPESIVKITKLRVLYLGDNKLTGLPESIGNLKNLTDLSLWQNQLTNLPETIGKLTNLTYLILYENKLTLLPETIGKLTNLTELGLAKNQLTSLPESIEKLTKIKELNLRGNQFICINNNLANKLQKNNNLKIKIDLIDKDENNDSCYYLNPTKKIMTDWLGGTIMDCNLSESNYVGMAMKRIKEIMKSSLINNNINELKDYLFKSLAFNLRPKIFDEISKRYSFYEQGLEKIKDEDFEKYESSKKNNEKNKNDEIKKEIEIFKGHCLEMIIDNKGFNHEYSSLLENYFAQETIDCYSALLSLKARKIKKALEKNESLKKEIEEKANTTYDKIMIDESKLYKSIMNNDLPKELKQCGMRKIDKELFQQCLIKKYSNGKSEINNYLHSKLIAETLPPEIVQKNKIELACPDFVI